jgi:hypothetical protein
VSAGEAIEQVAPLSPGRVERLGRNDRAALEIFDAVRTTGGESLVIGRAG